MRLRLVALMLLSTIAAARARAEQYPPRDIWPQVTGAARDGDLEGASKKTNELMDTGRAYGLKTYPLYATAAAGLSYQADKTGKKETSTWAAKTATQLDPKSSRVS